MIVGHALKVMLRFNISKNDLLQRPSFPLTRAALEKCLRGRKSAAIPDAVARHITEAINEREPSARP